MRVDVLNISGESTGRSVNLPDEIFGIEPNDHAIYLAVKQYLANQRQGTHKSKERNEIKGSTKKIKRQKGTGTARAGSMKNPLFRGGGRVFGPKPRDYSFKINKKVKALARNSALTYKAQAEKGLIIIEDVNFDEPKTKRYTEILKGLGVENGKTLMVVGESNENLTLSARNLKRTKIALARTLNTYSILNANTLIFCESAAKGFAEAE